MKKRFIKNILVIIGIFTVAVWSCKDDFTEEDLLQKQAEINQQNQAYADSVAAAQQAHADEMAKERVQYTVLVYNASVAASNAGGRTTGTTSVAGASVTIAVDGAPSTQTTDAEGMVVFEDVPLGSVAGTVTMADFTTVHFIANLAVNLTSEPVTSAGTLIPLFETTGENTATINGRVTYEGNLLNNTEETVPDGTVVSFMIDTEDPSFENAYMGREQTTNTLGQLSSIAFEGNFTTTTTGGDYSIQLPAAPQGLVYKTSFEDFTVDQTIAINNYENDEPGSVRDVVTIPTHFTQSTGEIFAGKYIDIPVLNAVQVDIDAPPASGSGAEETTKLVASSFDAGLLYEVVANGSGYAANSTTIPVTVSGGDYDATVTGATPADIQAISDNAGRIIALNIIQAGFGYRSRPTLTIGGAGSGAVIVSNYVSTVAPLYGAFGDNTGTTAGTVLTSGGTGYVIAPEAVFTGVDASGKVVSEVVGTEILNGSVVDVATPATAFRSAPAVEFRNIKRTQAFATISGIASGEITAFNVSNVGGGYNPLVPPSVTFRDLRNNGTGAIGKVGVAVGGALNGIETMIANGSGYSELIGANFPVFPLQFTIKTLLDNGTVTNLQNTIQVKSGVTRTVNAYYGTGVKERAVE